MPTGNPISPEQLAEAIRLRRRCWSNDRIAEKLGVHPVSVSRALARHERRAFRRLEARTAALKARQIDQLDWLAEEASDAWERSKENAVTVKVTEEAVAGGAGEGEEADSGVVMQVKTDTTTKGQVGDPRFLGEIRAALADQRKILRLEDAPAEDSGPLKVIVEYAHKGLPAPAPPEPAEDQG